MATEGVDSIKDGQQPAANTTEIIDLDPQGEILLETGSPPLTQIKVSALRLIDASPVFKHMLSGHFAEGQIQRSREHPQHLDLPDDNSLAVSDLGHLLYLKAQHLSKKALGAERLYNLVQAADKYGCVEILRLQLQALMQMHFDSVKGLHLESSVPRAATTYLLMDAKHFNRATSDLISESNKPLSAIRKLKCGDGLPASALLAMTEKRQRATHRFQARLSESSLECDGCGADGFQGDLLLTFDVESWPPTFEESRDDIIADRVRQMRAEAYLATDKDFASNGSCCRIDLLHVAD